MTETSQDPAPTLGEILWNALRAADPAGAEYTPFGRLDDDSRAAVEAGAQAVANAAVQRRINELDAQAEPVRYALVEQMGHRATVASIRETTFCGSPMLEVTDLKTGSVHLVSPQSLYEVSWLTEDEARSRAKPWTAREITAGDPWGVSHSDTDDEDDGKGCSCYQGPKQHVHDSDEDGDCVVCGCGQHVAPDERAHETEGNDL